MGDEHGRGDNAKDELFKILEQFRTRLAPQKAQEMAALMQQFQTVEPGGAGRTREQFLGALKVILGPELMDQLVRVIRATRTPAVQRPPGTIQPSPSGGAQQNVAPLPPLPASNNTPHAPSPAPYFTPSTPGPVTPLPLSSPSPSPLPYVGAARPAPAAAETPQPKKARTDAPRVNFAVPSAAAPASAAPSAAAGGAGAGDDDVEEGVSGGNQSVKALLDVTRIAGVDLKLEAQSLEAGGDEDEEGAPRLVQPENLVLGPELVKPIVIQALGRLDSGMKVEEQVHALLAHAAHERLRSLLEQLVQLSAHRHDAARGHLTAVNERDPRRTLKAIEKREREAKEKREEQERERLMQEAREQEAALKRQKGEGAAEALQETRERLSQMKGEVEDAMRTKSTNTTASLAIGERRKLSAAPVPLPLPPTAGRSTPSSGLASSAIMPPPGAGPALSVQQLKQLKELQELIRAGKALTAEQSSALAALQAQVQRRPAGATARPLRRITRRDLIALLSSDPASRTSRLVLAPRGKLTSEK